MSARPRPRVIGAFVLGSVALALLGLAALGAGRILERRDRFAVFFPGSVQGLRAGAPVTFRGIPIGEVVEVRGFFTGQKLEIQIEVVVEILGERILRPAAEVGLRLERLPAAEYAQFFVTRGIKAQMLSQSLLTGQKQIDLDFHSAPGRVTGLSTRYSEIPTVPSALEQLGNQLTDHLDYVLAKLAKFPFDDVQELVTNLRRTLASSSALLESGKIQAAAGGVARSTQELERTLVKLEATFREVDDALRDMRQEVHDTAGSSRKTLERADRALASFEHAADGGADLSRDASQALDDMRRTSAALRELLDYLQRHPESLLAGKPAAQKEEHR